MKLELKHIAPYLHYGLKCHCSGLWVDDYSEVVEPITVEIVGLNIDYVEIHEIGRTVTGQYDFSDVFIILHPFSDLTKEIEVNGEKFVPIEKVIDELGYNVCDIHHDWIDVLLNDHGRWDIHIQKCPYDMIEYFFKWHIDVFNLIPNKLAIDINDLKS